MEYILARSTPLENSKNNIYEVHDEELEQKYKDAGYQQYERSYKTKYQYKEYIVICLEFRNDSTGAEPVVIVPDFLIPGRRYPHYVYMHGIELYCNNPDKGLRWAAEETRKYFGLDTFSHTTLGRALKAFFRGIAGEDPTPAKDIDSEKQKPCFPSTQDTAVVRKQVAEFLRSRLGQIEQQEIIVIYCQLAREWHKQYQKLLL
ncbi:MAG: hypothetical protein FWF23_05450 [Alphaproteobacteria bacterium]|nr:hypothetical protein [Alphaproteobacteria bacterium]